MKRICGVFLSFILLLGLTGAAYASDAGHYLIDSFSDGEFTMSREEILEAGLDWFIVLEDDGVAQVQFDNLVIGTWSDGIISVTVEGETEELPYTIDGDALAIDMGGEVATFRRGDGAAAPAVQSIPPQDESTDNEPSAPKPEEPVSEAVTPLQQWWAGNWYGYWTISGVTDRYEALDDGRWDCYAEVTLAEDGAGSIRVWDAEDTLFTVSVTVSEASGSGAMGAAISEEGSYRDGAAIERADMIIDPSLYGYENYMVIDGYYESADDPDEGYYYWVYLRPWGQLWDDIPEEERPPQYVNWYLDRNNLTFDEAFGTSDTSAVDATESAESASETVQAPESARTLFAECPNGWQSYDPTRNFFDPETRMPVMEFRKGEGTEDDRADRPGMLIYYESDKVKLAVSPENLLGDPADIAPIEIGGRTWHGVAGEWAGDAVAFIHTDDDTDETISVRLWLKTYKDAISLEDADVVEIIASIRP